MESCQHKDTAGRVAAEFDGSAVIEMCEACFVERRDAWSLAKRARIPLSEIPCLMCEAVPARHSQDFHASMCDGCFSQSSNSESLFKPRKPPKPVIPESLDDKNRVFMGSRDSAATADVLREMGIERVLVLCPFLAPPPDGMPYLRLAVADSVEQDLRTFLPIAISHLLRGNVLLHCNAGISRTGAFAAYYLMHTRGLDYDEAIVEARKCRSQLYPNTAFADQLRTLKRLQ